MALDASQVINGTYCKVYHNGKWVMNAKGVELQGEINYEDINRAGSRVVGKKATSVEFTGTLTNYKVTHDFVKAIMGIRNERGVSFVTELLVEVNDPENKQARAWIRVKGVQFNSIPILNFEVGAILEEELPFTFTDFYFV